MDRHDIEGITAEEVAKAHQEDLKIQDRYNCKGLTYWYDEERGSAFCLIEAPDDKSVKEMHDNAHGLIPHQIIEVDSNLVETFLGRIENPDPAGEAVDNYFPVIRDPAFRSIMVTELKDSTLIHSEAGMGKGRGLVRNCNRLMKQSFKRHGGRVVTSEYDRFVVSFASVPNAVECAVNIRGRLENLSGPTGSRPIRAGIGIAAGDPVTDSDHMFGDTLQFARRLCYIASGRQIQVSSTVREQYKKDTLRFLSEVKSVKSLNFKEEQFLTRLMDVTERVWNREKFDVGRFCMQIGVSRSQLYRYITGITGLTPTEFIKEYRLKKAVELIETKQDNIARVAFETGFSNPSYFSKCFKKRYGLLPSEFRDKIH